MGKVLGVPAGGNLAPARCAERAGRLTLESNRQGNTLEVPVDGMSSLSALGLNVRWGEGTGASRVAVNLGVGDLDVTLD